MLLNNRIRKSTALFLFATLAAQVLSPTLSFALTSGPSQPEMQSFEPIGTTDMVNSFTGDFVYNIPLLDVDGYPVNIAYHGGISSEQEASWVGLGWNINPGDISRGVRGIPDDFDGETIQKEVDINPEIKKRFGMFFSLEVAGIGLSKAAENVAKMLKMNMGGSLSLGVDISNYTGVSASFGVTSDIGVKGGWMSAGVNMGATFTTDNGVDLNAGANAGYSSSANGFTNTVTGSFGKCYNSREGLKYTSFGVNPSFAYNQGWSDAGRDYKASVSDRPEGVSNTMVPIAMQNFVPVITNANFMESSFFQFKLGIEAGATVYPDFGGSMGSDEITFQQDGSRRAYGYFNLQNADKDDITDFTRDRDGHFNRDVQYLPSGNMTYDIYAVNGQGTAGNFRAFRADVGTVYDPYTNSDNEASNDVVEVGAGNIFEAGWDHVSSYTSSSSGPWNEYKNKFSSRKSGSIYEPYYFKQAGEPSEANPDLFQAIGGTKPLSVKDINGLISAPLDTPSFYDNQKRSARSNLLYFFTAAEASNPAVSLLPEIPNYDTPGSLHRIDISRTSGNRRANQASEFTQLLPDGRRYIYGIPAMNNTQVEYVMSSGGPATDDGTVNLYNTGACERNPYGGVHVGDPTFGQKLFMKTTTPSYAHSYLLTSILSPDYSDLTGDGLTDDDLGTYTKFNYSRKESNYKWRTPYITGTAQFDEGVLSDCHDDKATFVTGSKEIWMLHSIETKNYIAEFYTSPRIDGLGSSDTVATGSSGGNSYKLDSIILFNRRERLAAHDAAIPIKKVVFTYDYSLCKGIPNVASGYGETGKLTLKAISIKSGASDIGYLSPYRFSYGNENRNYSPGVKDMWGNYKPNDANGLIALNNHQFPYVIQDSANVADYAGEWSLTDIKLPSGGSIHVTYESDDYAYVQNRRAMEMFRVIGVGPDAKLHSGASSLYQSETNPYLYVYFERKKDGNGNINEWFDNMRKAYLDNGDIMQYNFLVKMSSGGEKTPSCQIPLEDHVKGYAAVDEVGICSDNSDYGYIKLSPKNVDKMPALNNLHVSNLSLNPVTLSAIFYAKYYNSKALYPSSEMVTADAGTIIKQLIASFADISDYFRSPIAKYLKDGRAKQVDLHRSFIRLCSQGKKLGGGHRVKRIEYSDNWDLVSNTSTQPVANYGSEYDYTTIDEATGRRISSGVASYEPLFGGDENPFKEPIATDRIGQKKDFPVVIPTELTIEGPIGESLYPSASVGYSKVTVTSIHKSEGASSQTILEHEFYTAKDFPVRTENTSLEKLEDRKLKPFDFSPDKKEAYRVGQGYSLYFNDMHGKPKKESVWVAKGESRQLVSYKKYEYSTNSNGTLNNEMPCMVTSPANNSIDLIVPRTLGIETDVMLDSREKREETHTTGFMANLNIFMGGIFPIPVPTAFPKIPKSTEKAFSSIVATKVIQQYGILKSVETFDKGSTVKLSNEVFDATTGQPLVTSVNTEHSDYEMQVKTPAYWAYRCMGPAYKNILYDESLDISNANIVADTFYFKTHQYDRYNVGDELLLSIDKSCTLGDNDIPQSYKVYVVSKSNVTPATVSLPQCNCPTPINNIDPILYSTHYDCGRYGFHNQELYVSYPEKFDDTGGTVDNICNTPYNAVIAPDPNQAGLNGDNTLAKLINPASNQPPQQLTALSNMLIGNSKYPLEAMNFDYVFNGLYNSGYNERWDFNNPFVPYGTPLPGGGKLPENMYFYMCEPPWHHGGVQAGGASSSRGAIHDYGTYSHEYPHAPEIGKTNKLLKVTIYVENILQAYAASATDTQYLFDLCNYHNAYNDQHNNYNRGQYVLYFPYDTSYSASKQLPSLASLTKTDVLFWSGWNHTTVRAGRRVLKFWFWSLIPGDSYFSSYPPLSINGSSYPYVYFFDRWFFTSSAEIIPRSSINGYDGGYSIAALPIKRRQRSATGIPEKDFPTDDLIYKGSIKVIRSGRRNQLQEAIQNAAYLNNDGTYDYGTYNFSPGSQVGHTLSIDAQTFTDTAAGSESVADFGTDYYNPYVTGMRGNYRLAAKYNINLKRDYTAATDAGKGILDIVRSFWKYNWYSGYTGDHYWLYNPDDTSTIWTKSVEVATYSPWGNDIEVRDAAGNKQATLFGYGKTLPIATVKNSTWNNALNENFEDTAHNNILNFYQNALSEFLKQSTTPVSFITSTKHTGMYALQVNSATATTLPVCSATPASFPAGAAYPFHFRPGKKYVVSYWQKADQNTANLSQPGLLSIAMPGGTAQYIHAKTPVIDGWVLFEGTITVPPGATPASLNYATVYLATGIIDDIRILPVEANMKCYVYNPVNRKLAAILDENHMTSFFEYDAEGKLVRVKKETEKGILTIKESRASVHSALNLDQSTQIDLKN